VAYVIVGAVYLLRKYRVRGTVSIVVDTVLCAAFGVLRLLCMSCVKVGNSVAVEWSALKPCCEGETGMGGVMLLRCDVEQISEMNRAVTTLFISQNVQEIGT